MQARQKADLEQQKALLVQIETLTAAAFGELLPSEAGERRLGRSPQQALGRNGGTG